jgi:hypothetical protein
MARRSIVKSRSNELKGSVADSPAVSVPAESALDPFGGSVPSTISELLTPRECADYRRCSVRTWIASAQNFVVLAMPKSGPEFSIVAKM